MSYRSTVITLLAVKAAKELTKAAAGGGGMGLMSGLLR